MLSSEDLERVIAAKKREIDSEKIQLGLSPPPDESSPTKVEQEHIKQQESIRKVKFEESNESKVPGRENEGGGGDDRDDRIPADLERYIRRYLGLPVMLKAGEFSPNNPLLRTGPSHTSDAFLGLGEYEERSKTLRRLRQKEYRDCLEEQAKKKQEAKLQEQKEQREREARERAREQQLQERDALIENARLERDKRKARERERTIRVDTATQVEKWGFHSVGVQTEESELYIHSASKSPLTRAERELSPRTVIEPTACDDRPIHPAHTADESHSRRPCRDRLLSDLKHSYMPSIFDEDAIRMRNLKSEEEAVAKRQSYQQELKRQIEEQQRIREQRKAREKMLEQAEMRRLEEQLRMLRAAQEREIDTNHIITNATIENNREYQKRRTSLQREIDSEKQNLYRSLSQSKTTIPLYRNETFTSKSESSTSKLPFCYSSEKNQAFSTNIPENSIFSKNYDVDSYLRRNLNPKQGLSRINSAFTESSFDNTPNVHIEKAQIHKEPAKSTYEPSFLKKDINELIRDTRDESLPIPVLRHSPKVISDKVISERVRSDSEISEAMKKVDDKWKVPVVQKNLLKSLPSNEGKKVNILTQLGSIRRQLQLEQLRLDKLADKRNE